MRMELLGLQKVMRIGGVPQPVPAAGASRCAGFAQQRFYGTPMHMALIEAFKTVLNTSCTTFSAGRFETFRPQGL